MSANAQFHDGVPGLYVVNEQTGISNYGPYATRASAQRVKREIDRDWGVVPEIVVVELRAEATP